MNIGAIVLLVGFICLVLFEVTTLIIKIISNKKKKALEQNSNNETVSEPTSVEEINLNKEE